MTRCFLTCLLMPLMASCAQPQTETGHTLIEAYSAAYNTKNLNAMSALMHPDIEWLSVEGKTIEVAVEGKTALTESMVSFFEDPNMATGTLNGWSINGNHVAVTETASWTSKEGEPKSQSALTVYELKDDLIRRVYYYSASKD